jgi:hypothetical protein
MTRSKNISWKGRSNIELFPASRCIRFVPCYFVLKYFRGVDVVMISSHSIACSIFKSVDADRRSKSEFHVGKLEVVSLTELILFRTPISSLTSDFEHEYAI